MKKQKTLALLLVASLSTGATSQLPVAFAQEAQEQSMADIYEPYFEHIEAQGDFAEQQLLSDKPLPKGTFLTFPHLDGRPNSDGSAEVARVEGTSDYYVFAPRVYENPYIYWQKWNGRASNLTTQHFAIQVTITYPDGSSEVIDSSVSMTPTMAMVHLNDLQYEAMWIVDGKPGTALPRVSKVPNGTKVEYIEDSAQGDPFSVEIDPETYELHVTPLSGFWDYVDSTNRPLVRLSITFPDGSTTSTTVSIDPIGSRPEPEPQPEPNPEPTPEPQPTPKPNSSSSLFSGSSF
jgi:hypothetical protein